MAHHSSPPPGERSAPIPSTFEVGRHVVRVLKVNEGRWSVTVDGAPLSSTYATQAEAWEGGVREADRIDRAGK
jgi:hypothetical protein